MCTSINCGLAGFHTSYSYDLVGNLTSYGTAENGITFSYQYDAASRANALTSSLVDSQHPATLATVDSSVGYYPHGALRKMTFGNGLTQATQIESRLQPCEINVNSSGSLLTGCGATPSGNIQDHHYVFGAWGSTNNGDVTTWTGSGTQNFNRSYSYDSLDRLSSLSSPSDPNGCTGLSWTYDAWGNRTDQTVTGGSCLTFHQTVNTQNRLANSPYQYDAAGNLISDGTHTYSYDAENRLVSVDGGSTSNYSYDALGQRVYKAVGSAITQFVHDLNGKVILDTDGNGNGSPVADYMYVAGNLVAEYKNSTTYFAHQDHLGSTRLVTDLSQSVVQNLDYLPFGELNSTDSGITTHEFTGDEQDAETDLAHTQFRQYAPSTARWMTPDPAGLAAVDPTNPQSLNRYAYVFNDPINFIDPLGLCAPGTICVTAWGDGGGDSRPVIPTTGSLFGGGAPGDINAEAQIFAHGGGNSSGGGPQTPLRPPTQKEYTACMQSAASTRGSAILNARGEQAVGGLLTLIGVGTAAYSLPALGEVFFNEGAAGLFDFAHAGGFAYFGALGPLGVGVGTFGKGTYDVANAWNQYYANTINCAAAVPSHP
jgi:RHS repeat-associated protein